MKLYYKPGACSLASHITLIKSGRNFSIEKVDTDAGQTETGIDYSTINAKGYVPALQLDNGEVLTEGVSILQYLAPLASTVYSPVTGSVENARLQEHLNYTASELHKAFGPFFSAAASETDKTAAGKNVHTKFDYLESLFADNRRYLVGERFSVADAYMFVVCNWAGFVGIDISVWPKLANWVARIAEDPDVQQALRAEGLAQ